MLRVLYFTASWCGPCKIFGPTVDRVMSQYSNVGYQKIDVDASANLIQSYNVSSVPTIVIEKNGAQVVRKTGAMSETDLSRLIESHK
jgi:thioredoxin